MKPRTTPASVALALAITPLAAPLLARSCPLAALLIRNFFSAVCHQNPVRSFTIQGSSVAVCIRCLGIYCGTALGILTNLNMTVAIRALGLAMLLNLLDVSSEMLRWHGNLPALRLLLGLLLGLCVGAVLQPAAGGAPSASAR